MTPSRSTSCAVRTGLTSSARSASIAAAVAAALSVCAASAAFAQDDSSTAQQVQALKAQVEQLQRRLDGLQTKQAAVAAPANQSPSPKAIEAVATPSDSTLPPAKPMVVAANDEAQSSASGPGGYGNATPGGPGIEAGPLTITFGGWTELALIYRNRDEIADVGSVPYSSIPFPDVENYYFSEFRESARQSRFSMLTQAGPWNGVRTEAYMETDFLGAAPTANSRESNSYNLRMRVFYSRFMFDSGFSVLAGQNWSLATLYKEGLDARQEDVPVTIDAQYVAGFNWTRNPQLRLVQKFNDAVSVGFSVESPQAVTNATNNVPSTLTAYPPNTTYQVTGNASGLLDNATNYTIDPAPDLIAKVAVDPGFGHYELYGLGRWFRSAVGTDTNTIFGGSVGGGAILPIVGDALTVQASGLVGKGVGRYGSAQLPDVTLEPDGTLSALKGYQALIGLFWKPIPDLQIYGYGGREQESADYFAGTITPTGGLPTVFAYGYGDPLYVNSGCLALPTKTSKCVGNVQQVEELTGGVWWKYYHGQLGNLQLGLQAAYNQATAFGGVGGAPETNVFEVMVSFRYYPYQR